MPDVEFVVAQEQKLTKGQYHRLLGEAQIVFSANLQETLGISAMEGVLVDAIPCLPNRLSYTEMYEAPFLYPQEWTESFASYEAHREELIGVIYHMLNNPLRYTTPLARQEVRLRDHYLTCTPLLERLG